MNFFASQDEARKKTTQLVVLFTLAVLILIALTNFLFIVVIAFTQSPTITTTELKAQFNWESFLLISAGVIALVGFSSLYKIYQLSSGGEVVADMMGGEIILDDGDLYKRRVLNVVEEMAIASGNPVPPVYLIHDDAINAFAAGTKVGNAVIGVTTGTIKKLNREQLQGVIAHEFSHIHNGDMRLNIRLIGILHGILVIGIIGYYILRSMGRGRRSRKSGGGTAAILGLGVGLMIIGYAGTFFGNIIKAGVSRQREYLADASAVQFTRNPSGIAGALKRIGGNSHGSHLSAAGTDEISHTLFGEGISSFFGSIFATHPALEKRIKAIEPQWDGEFEIPPENDPIQQKDAPQQIDDRESLKQAVISGATIMAGHDILRNNIENIGNTSNNHLKYAHDLIATIPESLKKAAHSPFAARAVIYYLIIDKNKETRKQQFNYLKNKADKGIYEEVIKLYNDTPELDTVYRLPIIEISLSALRQLSMPQYDLFKDNLNALIKIDNKISLSEWSLQKIVFHHLASVFEKEKDNSQNKTIKALENECATLLSFLIHAGKQDGIKPDEVFEQAKEKLNLANVVITSIKELNLDELNNSLDKLKNLKPLLKPKLLQACATCITADKKISLPEIELYRAISDILDCPMPPLVIN